MSAKSEPSDADSGSAKGDCPACNATNVPLKEFQGMLVCDKCASKRFSSKVRKSIQEAFDRQQAQIQRELWKKRIQVARKAMAMYENGKLTEALIGFREYLTILETHHRVPPGGLRPALFVDKKDDTEVLLLAGIYWDMAKVLDHTKGHKTDMRNALNKFIEFSIDRKHLILASEAMRRYIGSGKCVHKPDFNDAHRLLRSRLAKCFIAGAVFGPESAEVTVLRAFRDNQLLSNTLGRAFVRLYYKASPSVAEALVKAPWASSSVRVFLKPLTKLVARLNKTKL